MLRLDKANYEFTPIQFNCDDILSKDIKQPFPNKYLASFCTFLSDNRGHYMIENIIEDGLHDFIFQHLYKFRESWQYPITFTGSVAYAF
jgi:hypothetical protein